ncbi:MAG: hypothetical protein U0974_10325 [Gemmatimonadales bacterium]|nr:hypothetical protein [Gemmatimonadales bacterium]
MNPTSPPPPPNIDMPNTMLHLGPLACTPDQLAAVMAQWDCTPTECEVLVRLLMLESPADIARARGCTTSHIRNVINSIVHKSRSTAGVPGVLLRFAATLRPEAAPPSLDDIHLLIARAQERRRK